MSKFVDTASLPTMTFDWGVIKPLVAADNTEGTEVSMMHVILLPGKGHDRHNHPGVEEIIYVMSGEGEQVLDDCPPVQIRPGACMHIPPDVFHSTINTGWEPLRLLVVYSPPGAERGLRDIPGCEVIPAAKNK